MVNLRNLHLKFGEKISRKSFDSSRKNLKLNKKFVQGHKMNFAKNARENGQVAILTVVMFMLLFSVLVVSFTRIMVAASHETQSDELKAQALAAAESGIEDAKRILTYCYNAKNTLPATDPINTTLCKKVFSFNYEGQNCDTIINSDLLRKTGGKLATEVENDRTPNKQVIVGDEKSAQRYLCLKIATNTLDYPGELSADGKSTIIPLDFVNSAGAKTSPAQITIQWYKIGNDTTTDDGINANGLLRGSDFPAKNKWTNNNPTPIRVEFVKVPNNNITIQGLATDARAVTIRPSLDGDSGGVKVNPYTTGSGTAYDLEQWKQSPNPNSAKEPLLVEGCSKTGAYSCLTSFTTTIGGAATSFDLANNKYYLRLQAIYHGTRFTITATDEGGKTLYFNNVKPEIDVTGRAIDAFQRVKARVEPVDNTDPDANWFPEYAIDTGGKVCKNLSVTAESGTDNCDYE